MALPQSPFVNRLIAGATAPQVQVPYRPVQTQTPAPVAPVQNQAEMLRQRAFQAALARPDMPIPPEFSTGSALGDEQERLRARYALMRDAGRSAVAERARAQGRSVTYDQAGNPVIGDVNPAQAIGQYAVRPSGLMQSQVVDLPQGGRAVYDREGRLVGTNLSGISDLDATDRAAFNRGQGTVAEQARLRSAMEEGVRKAMQAPMAAAAATAPVAAPVAAPAAAPIAAAPVAAPAVRAPVPMPASQATPAAPLQFTPEEIMDPESAALEQQAAAVLEQERVRPIQAAEDAQTREFIRTRAARIADLQKATVARDPAKIQAALDSLRMLKEPVRRQPRAATPEPAALPPGSEGYEMSQLLGARPMTSQELNRLTPRQYDELVRQAAVDDARIQAFNKGQRQAEENFTDFRNLDIFERRREYDRLSRLNPELYPPFPKGGNTVFGFDPLYWTNFTDRPEPIR